MAIRSREKIPELEKLLGYFFKDKELLIQALTHPSFAFENNVPSNERLEFLGDAVLSLVAAERLYKLFPEASEGILTQRRAEIVQGTNLTILSQKMGLGKYLFLGKGEKKQGGHRTPSNLANVLEAIIGAIYLDGGIREGRVFIHRHFLGVNPKPATKSLKLRILKYFR
ncbi:MAG: ribonuclease III domain-containing protein [Candidatus Omnitrophota bacterium]